MPFSSRHFKTLIISCCLLVGGMSQAEQVNSSKDTQLLQQLINSKNRPEKHTQRDQYRHPSETLAFMDLQAGSTVVEIFPGGQGGWYRRIIEPFITQTNGRYFPVSGRSDWPATPGKDVPYGEADLVLVFRAHGFLIYDEPAQKHVNDLFKMLKPGGFFGIVDHAEREGIKQDPVSKNGYVQESYFKALALKAGFKLLKTSDVNRNEKDDKQHPNGVYSLPPTLKGIFGNDKYRAIGESDRFTHLYQKPLT